jgi:hypothetical protein
MIHTWDRTFLDHHRHFIEGMERFLNSRGAPLPIWDPATPVPPEFAGVEATDFGQPRPPLQNLNPRLPIPRHLLPPAMFTCGRERLIGTAGSPVSPCRSH